MVRSVAAPQHYVPPTTRELRAQAVHRMQIGIAGLAGMLLLVSLANIIMNRAQLSEAGLGESPAAEKNTAPNDPLADIGVAPAAVSSDTQAAKRSNR